MKLQKVPFQSTGFFSKAFLDYVSQKQELRPFYGLFPEKESFLKQISLKNITDNHRKTLVTALNEQYKGVIISEATANNISALADSRTFTVTTGHQLNIFTGPLYFIYKIVTAITTCRQLSEAYPEYTFVPVYWMASEDHDFEEISYFWLNGKKYQWETKQTGAVGHFDPKELKQILDLLPGTHPIFEKAYLKNASLAEAVCSYVNELFGKHGLVVIDADKQILKAQFSAVMKADLFDHTPFQLANKTTQELAKLDYHGQVNAREINFFYLDKGIRERIEKVNDTFHVLNTEIQFSETEMLQLIEEHPEKLSPNVILRPLYEETILPNLAYIGGPSEVVYWFQLKGIFQHFKTAFPILMPRNFALVIPAHIHRKWAKTGHEIEDLFLDENELITRFTKQHTERNLSLDQQKQVLLSQFKSIEKQATEIDSTLQQAVLAHAARFEKAITQLEKKLLRAEKRNLKDKTSQITDVKQQLFPGGSLQERKDNFLNFYMEDASFIDQLIDIFDPLDLRFQVIINE